MIDEMPCRIGTQWTTAAVIIQHQISRRAMQWSQLLSKSSADLHRGLRCFNICLSYMSNSRAFWMHLHNYRCFLEHLRRLWQSLRELRLPTVGPESIWMYLEVLVRSTGVSVRFACGLQSNLQFADRDCEMCFRYIIQIEEKELEKYWWWWWAILVKN